MKTSEAVTSTHSSANRHNTLTQRIVKWAAGPMAVLALAGCAKETDSAQTGTTANVATSIPTTAEVPKPDTKPSTTNTVVQGPVPSISSSEPVPSIPTPPTSANHPANPSKQISVDSFEGLILGLTVSDLSKKGYRESPACGALSQLTGPSGTLNAHINNKTGYVDQYSTQDPSVTTLSGIHVGSSKQDVLNAYGANITVKPQPFGGYGIAENLVLGSPQALAAQDSGVNIDFLVNDGKVSIIAMTRPGVDPDGC